jgi:uncharacterized protein YqeY
MDVLDLQQRVRAELREAMLARDATAMAPLRSVLSALANAEAVSSVDAGPGSGPIAGAVAGLGAGDVPRRTLSAAEQIEIVRGEIAERAAAADQYEELGRSHEATRLRAEVAVLAGLLE